VFTNWKIAAYFIHCIHVTHGVRKEGGEIRKGWREGKRMVKDGSEI
jgi:hypothetical protein